jgi:hypothetical protein
MPSFDTSATAYALSAALAAAFGAATAFALVSFLDRERDERSAGARAAILASATALALAGWLPWTSALTSYANASALEHPLPSVHCKVVSRLLPKNETDHKKPEAHVQCHPGDDYVDGDLDVPANAVPPAGEPFELGLARGRLGSWVRDDNPFMSSAKARIGVPDERAP